MIVINQDLAIPDDELRFLASRSSGPGGQNVNKVSTRVTVFLDVTGSPTLTDDQKTQIVQRLSTRISGAGVLRVTSQQSRSQAANREAATERLVELLRWALEERPERKPPRVPRMAKERRLQEKKRLARRKRERSARPADDD